MAGLKIIALCIAAAVVYGVLHDQVTTRICIEYFTVFHEQIIKSESPTVLAFFWGTVATWWAGLAVGIPALIVCRIGPWPKFGAKKLVRPITVLLATMAIASFSAGVSGYFFTQLRVVAPPLWVQNQLEVERYPRFMADWFAHNAAYGVGFLGGLVVSAWVWIQREKLAEQGRRAVSA